MRILGDWVVVVLPLLGVSLFVAFLWLWMSAQERRLKVFAAREGISYRLGKSPIDLPPVIYDHYGGINESNTFLWGSRGGIEVFSCNCRVGTMRGSIEFFSMVAVRAELHKTSGLDLERRELMLLNGWTFLVPRKPNTGELNTREIVALWDALTVAAGVGLEAGSHQE